MLNEERKRQEGNFETHEEIEKISVFFDVRGQRKAIDRIFKVR